MAFTKKQIAITAVVVVVAIIILRMGTMTGNAVAMDQTKTVKLQTNYGEIVIELYSTMPITAGNFERLVNEGFYDGTRFHRVIDGFMIQGGDPLSRDPASKQLWGTGGSDPIEDEFVEGSSNVRGTIAMANSGPNSGSSQFFINLRDNTYLDWDKPPEQSKHPVFGTVVVGMDVVDAIGHVPTDGRDAPTDDVLIISATVE